MATTPLYPLKFRPIFKTALWGGRRIAQMFPDAPAEGPISEAWLVSDVDNNVSIVADGPLQGTTLRQLMQSCRAELGLANHETFPLLIKIIDAQQPLSVQVHPNDEQAQRLEGQPRGKTEAWYVLHAEPGAKIYSGFKPGVDRTEFLRVFRAGRIEETLHSFEAKTGDCLYLPAGTIHAAGGGLTIFEVQQTSDITYRLHDWGRVDAKTGKPRELHVEKAIECLNFDIGPVRPCESRRIEDPDGGWQDDKFCPLFLDMRRTSQTTRQFWESTDCSRVLFGLDGEAAYRRSAGGEVIHRDEVGERRLTVHQALLAPPIELQVTPKPTVKYLDIWVSG